GTSGGRCGDLLFIRDRWCAATWRQCAQADRGVLFRCNVEMRPSTSGEGTALTGAVTLPAEPFGGTARNWGWQHTCFRPKGPDGPSHSSTWAPRAVGQEPSP